MLANINKAIIIRLGKQTLYTYNLIRSIKKLL